MGRPTGRTPRTLREDERILAGIRMGLSEFKAAEAAGVNPTAWYKRKYQTPDLQALAQEALRTRTHYEEADRTDASRETPPVPDFVTFRKQAFGHDTPPHQMAWVEALRPTGLPLFEGDDTATWDGVIRYCRLLILQPPEHGKTSFAEELIVWLICLRRQLKALFISKTEEVAKDRLFRIKNLLGDDPAWYDRENLTNVVETWGPFKARRGNALPWAKEKIYVLGHDTADRSATVEARGLLNQIQGARADAAVLDDVYVPENQYSENERRKQLTWLGQTLLSRLPSDGGLALVIGTRAIPGDNYQAIKDGGVFQVVEQPAIVDEQKRGVLWVERWPYDKLVRRREEVIATSGEASWLLTYQQQSTDLPDAPFKVEDLNASKDPSPDYRFGTRPKGLQIVMGFDPAQQGTAAIVVMGVDRETRRRVILDCVTQDHLTTNDRIKAFCWQQADLYKPTEVRVDVTSWQAGMFNDRDFKQFFQARGIRFVPADIQGRWGRHNKFDIDVGITICASRFEARQYSVPWNTMTASRFQPLLDECASWRKIPGLRQKQDRVVALWLAERSAMDIERWDPDRVKAVQKVPSFLKERPPAWIS